MLPLQSSSPQGVLQGDRLSLVSTAMGLPVLSPHTSPQSSSLEALPWVSCHLLFIVFLLWKQSPGFLPHFLPLQGDAHQGHPGGKVNRSVFILCFCAAFLGAQEAVAFCLLNLSSLTLNYHSASPVFLFLCSLHFCHFSPLLFSIPGETSIISALSRDIWVDGWLCWRDIKCLTHELNA